MILFLPIHNKTPGLDTWAADIKRKGLLPDHHLRICFEPADEDLSFLISDALSDHFKSVTTVRLAASPTPRGANKLANEMFFAALKWLKEHKHTQGEVAEAPLLYLDPTYRPSERNWVDGLQSEFFLKDSPPVMARTEMTAGTTKRLTVGPVIIGRKFLAKTLLLDYLDHREHWRSKMAYELTTGYVETRQIGGGGKSLLKPPVKRNVPA